jgi:hypothetical protein
MYLIRIIKLREAPPCRLGASLTIVGRESLRIYPTAMYNYLSQRRLIVYAEK